MKRCALGVAPAVEVLESAFGRLVPRKADGLVAVAVDGDGPHTWSAGSWTELPGPAAEPVFQIGSITKVFTALLLARAVDDDDVRLDDPVQPLRVGGRAATLRDLVTHRSGLPRLPRGSERGVDMSDPYRGWDEARLRASMDETGDRTKPGRDAAISYSNFGFAVLGLALSDALGVPWEQALHERVLRPAGMTSTGLLPDGPRAVCARPWDLVAFAPAGGLWTSAADLATWLTLLVDAVRPGDGDPLVEAVRITLVSRARTRFAHVGMAWQLFERDGVAWHNGQVLGARAFAGLDMRHGRAIGVLAVGEPGAALDRAAMRALTGH